MRGGARPAGLAVLDITGIGDGELVDVGAGTGRFAIPLAGHARDVSGAVESATRTFTIVK